MSGASARLLWASWSSASKSEMARRPRTIAAAPWRAAASTVRPRTSPTSTRSAEPGLGDRRLEHRDPCRGERSGVFAGWRARPTTTRSKTRERPAEDVEMAVRHRIERARVERRPSSGLLVWSPRWTSDRTSARISPNCRSRTDRSSPIRPPEASRVECFATTTPGPGGSNRAAAAARRWRSPRGSRRGPAVGRRAGRRGRRRTARRSKRRARPVTSARSTIAAGPSRCVAARFWRIEATAAAACSTKVALRAPRDSASIPPAPLPA